MAWVEKHLTYLRPKGRPDMDRLTTQAAGMLVVIDTVGKLQQQAFPGSKSVDYDDFTHVEQEVLRPLTEAGCTVCTIDHEAKANGGTQFGTVAKGGAADLAWHVVKADGITTMMVSDDRHAPYEEGVPVAQLVISGSSAVLTAEFAQEEVSGKAVNRDIKVLDAVARAPGDYWTTTSLAEHLTETSGDGKVSTWKSHIRSMIMMDTLGTAPGTGRAAYLRPPMATAGVAAKAGEHQDQGMTEAKAGVLAQLQADYAE